MVLKEIQIREKFGEDELDSRLRKVRLKGFQEVEIYADADIAIKDFTPQEITERVFTPQPSVYRNGYLERVEAMNDLFSQQGIDMANLSGGVDYIAVDDEGVETEWTLIPPVVEMIKVNFDGFGLDYSNLLSLPLKNQMVFEGHRLNPDVRELAYDEYTRGLQTLPIICDGSHRIHSHREKGLTQKLLVIDGPQEGFPYYAAPKPYSEVKVILDRPDNGGKDKVHVLTSPGHKLLYRLFPSGGILSGDVRTPKK